MIIGVRGVSAVMAVLFISGAVAARPVVNGSIAGGEGWNLLTEAAAARPLLGGSASASDRIAETSSFHWWDGINNVDRPFSSNRADLINFHVSADSNFLYIGVTGPTAIFNAWNDGNGNNGDQGDLFVAIDAGGGAPGGMLNAQSGHSGFGATKSVDFLGWRPSHIVGIQYVDNGGGGGGRANLEQTGFGGGVQIRNAAQGVNDNGFAWNAGINGGAGYDTFDGNAGELEFQIPWTALGLDGGLAVGRELRFAAYITQNFGLSDAYDSLPGWGNGFAHEEIGDNPGDPDSGGQLGASDPGSFIGSFPGANFVGDLSLSPSHDDGVDTIEEYLVWAPAVPAPGSAGMLAMALLATGRRRR
jgi:hypothetical protein